MLFDLVFEGGGVRGIAFIGALEALAAGGHEIDRVMGTSVGGLTAALLATGHDVTSLREHVFNLETGRLSIADVLTPQPDFTQDEIDASATRRVLRDVDFPFVPNMLETTSDTLMARSLMTQERLHPLFSVLERMSVYSDGAWLAWLTERLNANAGGEDWASLGLAELYRRHGRSLTMIASDATSASMLVLNHGTAPDLPLRWAVRMTTSVPYLFPPVAWRPEWGLYRGRRVDGHLVVDGALLSQFPLELFLSPNPEVEAIMGVRKAGNNVLGLLLDETAPVPGVATAVSTLAQTLNSMPGLAFTRLLLQTLMSNANLSAGSPVESHVIRLPVMGVDPYGFDTKSEQLIPVINQAYNVTQDFLHGWQADPRSMLTTFQQQYVQVVAEKFVVSGDYYRVGDIINSTGIAIGEDAAASVEQALDDEQRPAPP